MMNNAMRIRKELNQWNMTQKELAELMGVTERTIRNWLRINGNYEASDRTYREIIMLLGSKPHDKPCEK